MEYTSTISISWWISDQSSTTISIGSPRHETAAIMVAEIREATNAGALEVTNAVRPLKGCINLEHITAYGCWTKNWGGKPPKMDGENMWK